MPPRSTTSQDLARVRQQRLLLLNTRWKVTALAAGQTSTDRAFCAVAGLSPSLWNQYKAGRVVGERQARQIEQAFELEAGWLDQPSAVTSHSPAPRLVDIEPLAHSAQQVLLQALGPKAQLVMPWMQHSTPAGFPSMAADFEVARVDLSDMLELDEPFCFMTKVSGQSMVNEGIQDGDLIVVNRAMTAKHGDIVVAVVDNEVTLKTLYQKDGLTKLVPANPAFPEIVLKEGQTLEVWGVMTACVKLFGRKG